MKWYLAKLIYRIICGEGMHTPQFDEQLRLIQAENDFDALQKARAIGRQEEDQFLNDSFKPVHWKFIDITELQPITDFIDGVEIHSSIQEKKDAEHYLSDVRTRALILQDHCFLKTTDMN